jgi:formate dehydrogenase
MILALVRNYIPSHQWALKGGWNIADCVARSYDLEGMNVGIVGAGRIGLAAMRRVKPFDVNLHYADRHRLAPAVDQELGATFHPDVQSLVKVSDVVSIQSRASAGARPRQGTPANRFAAGRKIDARCKTGKAPDERCSAPTF